MRAIKNLLGFNREARKVAALLKKGDGTSCLLPVERLLWGAEKCAGRRSLAPAA